MYNYLELLGFRLFPSFGILETRKHDVSETGSVSVFRWRGKTSTQLGSLERANLNQSVEYRTMEKSKNPVILSVMQHRQNLLNLHVDYASENIFCS
jgi:hypothetical protein